jgi:hypothetical protein
MTTGWTEVRRRRRALWRRAVGRTVIGDPGRSFREVSAVLRPGSTNPPDTVLDGGSLGPIEVRAASVCGLAHRQSGKARQDAYAVSADPGGVWLVVAVADGVSAGALSHEAATIVARHGVRQLTARLTDRHPRDVDWYELFSALAHGVLASGVRTLSRGQASGTSPSPADVALAMSTTVTFVAYATRADGARREVSVAWWGDSPAWEVSPDGAWTNLSAVKSPVDGISRSDVAALPYLPPSAEHLPVRHLTVAADARVLVMSDGVGDPLGDGTGEVAAALARMWRQPPRPLVFADQVGFGRKSYDDDRTVVAIWPDGHTGR